MSGLKRIFPKNLGAAAIALGAALFLVFVFNSAEKYFSSTAFCISCHAMKYPYEGLKRSAHWGKLGIDPGCGDCHMPAGFFARLETHMTEGVRDVTSEFRHRIRTKEEFDRHRLEFASRARENIRRMKISPCRTCHKAPRPASEFGRLSHQKMRSENLNCVDCHQEIFHPEQGALR